MSFHVKKRNYRPTADRCRNSHMDGSRRRQGSLMEPEDAKRGQSRTGGCREHRNRNRVEEPPGRYLNGGVTKWRALPDRTSIVGIRLRPTASIMEIAPIFRRNAVPLGQNRMQCGAKNAVRDARLKKSPVRGSRDEIEVPMQTFGQPHLSQFRALI